MNTIILKTSVWAAAKWVTGVGPCVWMMTLLTIFYGRVDAQIAVDLTTPGAGTWTVPAGVTEVVVEAWGGGGRGRNNTAATSGGSAGGGGGAYSKSILTVSPGSPVDYYVGNGSATTDPGADSWFLNQSSLLAKGGNSEGFTAGAGGMGGQAIDGVGNLARFSGGNGANRSGSGTFHGGGGGSSAGTGANGTDGSTYMGGVAPAGGGNGGNSKQHDWVSDGASEPARAGGFPGGGGGGTYYVAGGFNVPPGGKGGDGLIRITYTPAAPPEINLLSITPASLCPNSAQGISVPYTTSGFAGAQTFTVELSNASGSFASPVVVGTGGSSPLTATIPGGALTAGGNFKLRIVRYHVDGNVFSNESNVALLAAPSITPGTNPSVCAGATSVSLPYSGATGAPDQYSIVWGTPAVNSGFQQVANATLAAGAINITVPSGAGAATYTGTLTVRNSSSTCVSSNYNINVVVNERPVINSVTSLSFCQGSRSSIALPYDATISSGTYNIQWDVNALSQNFTNIVNEALWPSPLSGVNIPLNTPAGVYTGTLTVRNGATGCVSAGYDFSLTSRPLPTIFLGANPSVCQGATSAMLPYSSTTQTPDQYSIAWETPAGIAGFSGVSNASFPVGGAPITVPVPANVAPGTYDGRLFVKNTTTGCESTPYYTFQVQVIARPAITLGANPSICMGATSASLSYNNPVNTPGQYSIVWSMAAANASFVNITNATLPSGAISIAVPAGTAQDTYAGKLTVRNTTTGCVSLEYDISVTVGALPSITLGAHPEVCTGVTTAPLTYSGVSASPDQYSVIWSTAAGGVGFTDVTNATLPSGQIGLTIPVGVTPATYTGTLKVRSSSAGCESTGDNISVTVHARPVASVTTTGPVALCAGDDTLLTANSGSGYSYEWKGSQGTTGSGVSYTANATGYYYVVVTDGNNCKDSSAVVPVTVYTLPQVTVTPADTSVCEGEIIRLHVVSADTGLVFNWKESGTLLPGNEAFKDVSASGSYYVVAGRVAVAGCADSSAVADVMVHPLPAVSVIHDGNRLLAGSGFVSYQWFKDNDPVDGETNSAFEPTTDGGYSVQVTDSNGCRNTSALENIVVGVKDMAQQRVRIYPNPVDRLLYIESAGFIRAAIYSVEGRLRSRHEGVNPSVDVSGLPAGIYIIRLTDGDNLEIGREQFIRHDR